MPRPTNKDQLLQASELNFKKLFTQIDSLDSEQQESEFPAGTLNRNIRDVLAHLHHWHLMMLEWYAVGMSGEKPIMPAPGYTWKTVPDLNRNIQEQYRNSPLEEVRSKLEHSHQQIQNLIEKHSNTELFEKKHYPWTGSTSLGAYLISASSSHYDWALKLLKRVLKKASI